MVISNMTQDFIVSANGTSFVGYASFTSGVCGIDTCI